MASRMDRYKNEENLEKNSRINQNKELYQNVNNNTRYATITDVTNSNAIDLTMASKEIHTREGYQHMKNISPIDKSPSKKELDEFNYLYKNKENKVYDINKVLDDARKNRENDDKEPKRCLKNDDYNIITSLNKEELEKYREKTLKPIKPSEDNVQEIIDTIATKTIDGEIDKATSVNLLSDLMATNVLDKVEPANENEETEEVREESNENIDDKLKTQDLNKIKEDISNEKITEPKEKDNELEKMDTDFFTKSMDLSSDDLEMDDEFKEKTMPVFLKVLLIIVILIAVAFVAFYIYKKYF